MKKTSTWLADGRELIYFDEDDAAVREGVDTRDLPEVRLASEIRYDPRFDDWVIVASHRQDRTYLPPADQCPLCPTTPGNMTEIPSSGYDVVVFENRYPSLARDVPAVDRTVDAGASPFIRRPGTGRCEVVCFSSEHDLSFSRLTPDRVRTVLEVWIDRTRELSSLPFVEHVYPFENRGEVIGVTLSHPHGQIYAYPFIPSRVGQMLGAARRHRERRGTDLFEDLVAAELKAARRVVAETNRWAAFVPAAARWPEEVHLFPKRRVPDLPALDEEERSEFPLLYLDILKRLDALYGTPLPYIAGWQQAPVKAYRDVAALHLEIMSVQRGPDKLKYIAGSESGMGAWINDTTPEFKAERLRNLDV